MRLLINSALISVLSLLLSSTSSYAKNFSCHLEEEFISKENNSCLKFSLSINKKNKLGIKKNLNKNNNIYIQKNIYQKPINRKITSANIIKSQQTLFSKTKVANFLPAKTPLLAVATTSPSDWQRINRFQLFKMAEEAVSPFIPNNLKQYAPYLQPFLGSHIAFAFLPKSQGINATLNSNFIMLAEIQNKETLNLFINNLTSQKNPNQKIKQKLYKGINIIEIETNQGDYSSQDIPLKYNKDTILKSIAIKPSIPKLPIPKSPNIKPRIKTKAQKRNLAFALVSGYFVVGTSIKPIKQVIDTSTSKGSIVTLANSKRFQSTLKHPQAGPALFGMYQNPQEYIALIKDLLKDPKLLENPNIPKNPNIPTPPANLDEILKPEFFAAYKSINSFITVQPQGLRFQIATYLQTPSNSQIDTDNSSRERIISWIPGATYSTLTGRDINGQWQKLATLLSTQPKVAEGLESFRNYSRIFTGLDFDRDIIKWMNGEYAFFSYPTKGGFLKSLHPQADIGIGLNIQTSNPTLASATLTKLDKLIQNFSNNEVIVNKTNINGHPITSWESKGKPYQSLFAYSWVNENTLILTTGKGAIASLVPKPYLSLLSSYNFKTATNTLPHPNQGYFYVNTGSFLSWVYKFIPKEFNDPSFQIFKKAIGSVYSLSATTSKIPEGEQLDFLIVLAPVRKQPKFLEVKNPELKNHNK
ncbi:MAG: DUF3352 domain-containing protein [Cyanobacteria bacterium P01_A01_bin.84]